MSYNNKIVQEDLLTITNSDIAWNEFDNKTFLISGANGMLPSYLVYSLLKLKKEHLLNLHVIAVVRNKDKLVKKLPSLDQDFITIIEQDINQTIKLNRKIDFVIHGASQASPKNYYSDPVGTILPNILGTKNLLELSVQNTVEGFLFLSSGEVYGDVGNKTITETNFGHLDSLDLRSCYAESKRMGENMCLAWNKQFDVPIKIARVFHTYGPGMKLDDGRVFADFVSDVVNNKDIKIKGDGEASRPFCYIVDAVIAFFLILLKGEKGNAYNVSNPNCIVTIKELANIIANLFPDKKLKVVKNMTYQPQEKYMKSRIVFQNPDISKLRKLGWKPIFSIEEGFSRTIKSYLQD